MRALLPLTLALVLALAGCSGFLAQESTYPPGLDSEGVVSGEQLADAHADQLENTSYTIVSFSETRYPNGTLRENGTSRILIGEDVNRYYSHRLSYHRSPTGKMYPALFVTAANGTHAVVRHQYADDPPSNSYKQQSNGEPAPPRRFIPDDFYHERVDTLLSNGTYTVEKVPEGYLLTGETNGSAERLGLGPFANDTTVTDLRVRVAPDGHVIGYRFAFTYGGAGRGERVHYVEEASYRDIGSTTVPEPDWFDETVAEQSG